ncbi:hypothetical protein FQN50_002826 [Emmonsiellopsis sp. PD_5]|nr:hypothetical protein FQN50_002826 [Emmonsiellopsis sp. PD_5]
MASKSIIPPFLLPQGISKRTLHLLTARNGPFKPQPQQQQQQQQLRQRSTTSTNTKTKANGNNGRVLEKPDRFRPPSHPSRRVMNANARGEPRNYPGPALSAKEVEEKKTKRYPNMFPPEGTVMHKFLTSKGIHVWISMSVLVALATFTFSTNFKQTSPFAHLLPSWSELLVHPINTVSQVLAVMKMTADHETLQTAEKRKRKIDDVEKRRSYRVAHGLEKGVVVEGGEGESDGGVVVEGEEGGRRKVKKWLGIW